MAFKEFNLNDTQGTRRPTRMQDQHGREWFAEIDPKSGFPIGLVRLKHRTPGNNKVPWEPDQGFLIYTWENPNHLTIDYQTMLTDRLAAHEEYHAKAVELCVNRGWSMPTRGEPYEEKVVQVVGKPPRPWQPIKAAMDGNSWILGFTDTVDMRLVEFVRKPNRVEKLMGGLPSFADEVPIAPATEKVLDEAFDAESEEMLQQQVEAMRSKATVAHGKPRTDKGQFVAKEG